MQKKILTLCFIHDDKKVLLGMKKRGFGVGRWNGFGGKVHDGEMIEEAARREFFEETGLQPDAVLEKGALTFVYNDDNTIMEVYIFSVLSYAGELKETEEMLPKWFSHDEIPFEQMWPDDKYWLPLFLKGKKLKGEFIFSDKDTIIDYSVTEL